MGAGAKKFSPCPPPPPLPRPALFQVQLAGLGEWYEQWVLTQILPAPPDGAMGVWGDLPVESQAWDAIIITALGDPRRHSLTPSYRPWGGIDLLRPWIPVSGGLPGGCNLSRQRIIEHCCKMKRL